MRLPDTLFVRSNNRKEPPEKPRACVKEGEVRESRLPHSGFNPGRCNQGRSSRSAPGRYRPRRIALRRAYSCRPSMNPNKQPSTGRTGEGSNAAARRSPAKLFSPNKSTICEGKKKKPSRGHRAHMRDARRDLSALPYGSLWLYSVVLRLTGCCP